MAYLNGLGIDVSNLDNLKKDLNGRRIGKGNIQRGMRYLEDFLSVLKDEREEQYGFCEIGIKTLEKWYHILEEAYNSANKEKDPVYSI